MLTLSMKVGENGGNGGKLICFMVGLCVGKFTCINIINNKGHLIWLFVFMITPLLIFKKLVFGGNISRVNIGIWS